MYDINKEKIASRYASAIYDFAKKLEIVDEIKQILYIINTRLEVDKKLYDFLISPLINIKEKKKCLLDNFNISDENVKKVLFYLLKKNRIDCLKEIYNNVLEKIYKDSGSIHVIGIFVKELNDDQKNKLIKKLENKYNKKIVLTLEKDENIIGGGIIKVGSNVIDGSLKYQIEAMKKTF